MSKRKPTNNTKAPTILEMRKQSGGYLLTTPTNREQRRLLAKEQNRKKP